MDKFNIFVCGFALMVVGIQAAAIPAEFQEPGKAAHDACVKESGLDADTHAKFVNFNFEDDDKCYFKCIFGQFGLIDKDAIDFEAMMKIIPESMKEGGSKAVNNCRKTTGKDLCEQSYNLVKCFYKEDPQEFFVL